MAQNETYIWLRAGEIRVGLIAVERIILVAKKTNSVALVRKRTIPTERPQLVGEVIANSTQFNPFSTVTSFLAGNSAWSAKLITHLHLVLGLFLAYFPHFEIN
jgi:hypothetical protein